MLERFMKEERGQGAIEYIILAGGIIVAAVIIFVIYKQAASSAGAKMNETINETAGTIKNKTEGELAKLSK